MTQALDLPAAANADGGDLTLATLFEAQADRTPDALAVLGEDGSLTYRELDEAANRVAGDLIDGGVAAGEAVLCAFERSCASLVAQIAVYKAGAAYAPADPEAPRARLRHLAARIGAAALLSTEEGIVALGDLTPRRVPVDLAARATVRPAARVTADGTAYVIFTSGSTGEPKGVVVSHRAIVSTTLARFRLYPEPVSRFLILWRVTFDAGLGFTWWTLASGGTVEQAPASLDGVMAAVDAALTGEKPISHTAMTPSHYHEALQRLPGPVEGPGTMIVAGEPCSARLVAEHHRLQPATRLYNEYGPTEAAVWCTGTELRADAEVTAGPAIQGAGILVLDESGREVPAEETGEVYVTGAGLADGYAGDAGLTAERFLEHPDGRRYRTGDIGRLLRDGRLVVVGRTDDQLKIRGHRIEPGEVETVLQSHPDVARAVVTESQGRLVAFVVRRDAEQPAGSGGP